MNPVALDELQRKFANVSELISGTRPGSRHHHLPELHDLIGNYTRRGLVVPAPLRQLQEDLTNEAIESRFDNMPV
ncbi:hypothetical protein [Pseudooceanicola marinus]|uniref:hypothetical protein n=1 Tax=Pseudooceanicola marinus TaxID=396013 RepID=UPI001C9418FC|nr:hypothetical protein [Pseudooceanicola marinus]MBY5972995.1 hypothetical protein [Ferrimonas balearica]MCA1336848.1 hypothetical protein [Pseudooceanicola marinus]